VSDTQIANENAVQKTYTTGELAEACGVTVRTVQYYDEKGLLPPAALSEGGRRIYIDDDAEKLRRILLLKSLGLKLNTIRDIMGSRVSTQVLIDILHEQDSQLAREVEERTGARERIAKMLASLESSGTMPEDHAADAEDNMGFFGEGKLGKAQKTMLLGGIPLSILEWGTLIYALVTWNWWPFAIAMIIAVIGCTLLVRIYRENTAYICPHCHQIFVPSFSNWFFARHTPKTRKLTCTHCNEKDWCAEVSAERLKESI
jgi:DNA-binding transcriptional MerR regulator/DNA-directed RNA polymerase subunit RPC12/RpoP